MTTINSYLRAQLEPKSIAFCLNLDKVVSLVFIVFRQMGELFAIRLGDECKYFKNR